MSKPTDPSSPSASPISEVADADQLTAANHPSQPSYSAASTKHFEQRSNSDITNSGGDSNGVNGTSSRQHSQVRQLSVNTATANAAGQEAMAPGSILQQTQGAAATESPTGKIKDKLEAYAETLDRTTDFAHPPGYAEYQQAVAAQQAMTPESSYHNLAGVAPNGVGTPAPGQAYPPADPSPMSSPTATAQPTAYTPTYLPQNSSFNSVHHDRGLPGSLPPRSRNLSIASDLQGPFGAPMSPAAAAMDHFAGHHHSASHHRLASLNIHAPASPSLFGTPALSPFMRSRQLGGPKWQFPPFREEDIDIGAHGLIGNMHTCALVSTDAEVSWFCYPDFDSPSLFGSILDRHEGGRFNISVATQQGKGQQVTNRQIYHSETNVLLTRFMTDTGVAQVQDYMPVGKETEFARHWLIREVEAVRGKMYIRVECCPRFNYGRTAHEMVISHHGAKFKTPELTMQITSSKDKDWKPHPMVAGGAYCDFALTEGEKATFVFREAVDNEGHPSLKVTERLRRATMNYWRSWISKCTYNGRWRETVYRSALALKLMQYEPTGAIVAAATMSLPEEIGGVRNWDYRFTWIRDSSLTLSTFLKLGFREEATAFWHFLTARLEESSKNLDEDRFPLQIMYSIHGKSELVEETLPHLSGYKNSQPVRIGNGAFNQLQLDIYGELLDAIWLADQYEGISYEFWRHVCRIVDWVCNNWKRPDESIWEVRGGRRHFTYSKVMLWVAVDRGIRIATSRSFPCDIARWRTVRDTIFEDIQTHAYHKERQAFTQFYSSAILDASVLVMPLVRFCSPTDPRFVNTLNAILKSVNEDGLVSNNLVFRYNVEHTQDGISGDEGTFSLCTFWAVEATARLGYFQPEYLEKARLMFEQMLGFANHVGLYAEEIGARGEQLGNFPQAFTHLSLVHAAVHLDRALKGRQLEQVDF